MTSQEKKAYLSKYKFLDNAINQKLEECEKWRAMAEKITPTLSDMPKSQSGANRIETAVEHIAQLEEEINKKVDELVRIRRNIEDSLQSVKDDTLRNLLEYRYIYGLTWEQIAVKMNYSYRNVTRMHGKALSVLECPTKNVL